MAWDVFVGVGLVPALVPNIESRHSSMDTPGLLRRPGQTGAPRNDRGSEGDTNDTVLRNHIWFAGGRKGRPYILLFAEFRRPLASSAALHLHAQGEAVEPPRPVAHAAPARLAPL
jgi:hypothetical protein